MEIIVNLINKLIEEAPKSTFIALASILFLFIGACLGIIQEAVAPLTAEQMASGYMTYGAALMWLGAVGAMFAVLGFALGFIVESVE